MAIVEPTASGAADSTDSTDSSTTSDSISKFKHVAHQARLSPIPLKVDKHNGFPMEFVGVEEDEADLDETVSTVILSDPDASVSSEEILAEDTFSGGSSLDLFSDPFDDSDVIISPTILDSDDEFKSGMEGLGVPLAQSSPKKDP
eukprot:scpid106785/ scgid9405/ 